MLATYLLQVGEGVRKNQVNQGKETLLIIKRSSTCDKVRDLFQLLKSEVLCFYEYSVPIKALVVR